MASTGHHFRRPSTKARTNGTRQAMNHSMSIQPPRNSLIPANMEMAIPPRIRNICVRFLFILPYSEALLLREPTSSASSKRRLTIICTEASCKNSYTLEERLFFHHPLAPLPSLAPPSDIFPLPTLCLSLACPPKPAGARRSLSKEGEKWRSGW
jgi:hypothetical protein